MTKPKSTYLDAKGLGSWLRSTDHKRIGIMYLLAITLFFLIGSLLARWVQTELFKSAPGDLFSSADLYNRAFTTHGIVMLFLVIIPGIPATFGNFLLPLMIGARNMRFPRMNLFSWYLYILGALFSLASLYSTGLDTGWTLYTPYGAKTASAVIFVSFGVFLIAFSSVLTGINFVVTIHNMRCKGMTWLKMPIFVWTLYATAMVQVLLTPVLGITLFLLLMERVFHIGIFDPLHGANSMLFQNFFWFYSHPLIYIMILPAFGVVSEIIPVFSRKPLFAYCSFVFTSIAIAFMSFLVWGNHLFSSGMSDSVALVFSFLTFFAAIPIFIQLFNWIATLYRASISFETPMIWALMFLFLFSIASLAGVYLAALPLNLHLHGTYFVVGQLHYALLGGAFVMIMAATHYWFALITGRSYNDKITRWLAALFFLGFNGTFLPMFVMGLQGLPRRFYQYSEAFQAFQQISTLFSLLLTFSLLANIAHLLYSAFYGKKLEKNNPFNSCSLEYSHTTCPPPKFNFNEEPELIGTTYDYATLLAETPTH